MPENQTIPTAKPADQPSFTVKVNGSAIPNELQIQSVVVSRSFNKIASAEIAILDGDPALGEFSNSNREEFAPGNELEILAGYHGDESLLFKGIVTRHAIRVYAHKPSVLKVEIKDAAVKLSGTAKNAYFYEANDADIMDEIIAQAGLSSEIEATNSTHPSMVQFNACDWDFILTRAEANGKLVSTLNGTMVIKKPAKQSPELTLAYGGNMMDFEAVIDARTQYQATHAFSWQASDQAAIEEPASKAGESSGNLSTDELAEVVGDENLQLKHLGLEDVELEDWANSHQVRQHYAKVRGRVRSQGYGNILPGHFVTLQGVGERFNGDVLVSGVRHEISAKNWETDITFGLSPEAFAEHSAFNQRPAANGLLPAISGLQIGLVTNLEDPDGEERIQVRLPMVDADEEGVWARMASLDAGESRGAVFRPEIDDEVVVGFLNEDPRNPIILGMLNSSAKPAAIVASNDNHEKGFVTRSELQLLFNDETAVIQLSTPNGNQFELSEEDGAIKLEDENGNKLLMDQDGIHLESAKDLNIKASGDINLDANNINASASQNFKAEGSSGAELSSGASTTIKGSIVQIN